MWERTEKNREFLESVLTKIFGIQHKSSIKKSFHIFYIYLYLHLVITTTAHARKEHSTSTFNRVIHAITNTIPISFPSPNINKNPNPRPHEQARPNSPENLRLPPLLHVNLPLERFPPLLPPHALDVVVEPLLQLLPGGKCLAPFGRL